MAEVENTEHHEEHFNATGASHIHDWKIYLRVWVILLVLMVATIAAAQVDLDKYAPGLNNIIAMTIAVTKAILVVLFFMQVKYSTKLTWLWASIGFIWLIFLFATMGDYLTREWVHVVGWQ